jgi:Zn-dependent protease
LGDRQLELEVCRFQPIVKAMDANGFPEAGEATAQPPKPGFGARLKKLLGPVGVGIVALFAKFKFLIVGAIKFLPILLKTGGTMILSVGVYAMLWGWRFALGFVLLIFVHECGHLIAAKWFGLKVSAPMFIPFFGAVILLKESPSNAWVESVVGIGGPMLGSVGAVLCEGIYQATGNPMFRGLAYTGFWLNLFNLAPVGFLDGGRIVTALSPWLWLVGFVLMLGLTVWHFNFLLLLILIMSLPRLFSLFRKKTDEEKRYFEVTPVQRATMAILYFGLIAALGTGMALTYIPREQL